MELGLERMGCLYHFGSAFRMTHIPWSCGGNDWMRFPMKLNGFLCDSGKACPWWHGGQFFRKGSKRSEQRRLLWLISLFLSLYVHLHLSLSLSLSLSLALSLSCFCLFLLLYSHPQKCFPDANILSEAARTLAEQRSHTRTRTHTYTYTDIYAHANTRIHIHSRTCTSMHTDTMLCKVILWP